MRKFFDDSRHAATRPLLFDPVGPVWTGRGAVQLNEILATAPGNGIVQENARLWLIVACSAAERKFEVLPAAVTAFMAAPKVVPALWAAVVASPLQFRALSDTCKLRDELISCGADETALYVPDWLQDQLISPIQ
jgi:hypothetical protein